MAQFVYPSATISTTGLATETKQDTQITHLATIAGDTTSLDAKDFATETTLALMKTALDSVNGKDFATQTTLAQMKTALDTVAGDTTSLDGKDYATQTTLALMKTALDTVAGDTTSLDGKDFATQTTLAAILADTASLDAKDYATQTTLALMKTALDTVAGAISGTEMQVDVLSSALPTGASTAAHQVTQNAHQAQIEADITLLESRLAGALIPEAHDYIAITYVAAGNGEGEIETVVYKTGGGAGTTVGTLTLAYDANHKLSTVTKS